MQPAPGQRPLVTADQDHLGGYMEGGDPTTWMPKLWAWAIERYGSNVLDIGCGEGYAVKWLRDRGSVAIGIEGTEQDEPAVMQHDFEDGPFYLYGDWRPDWVWSCEFVEHVEERFLPNLQSAFSLAPVVLMTHAFPGQPGVHHVNCQEPEYWHGVFAAWGYERDLQDTSEAVEQAGPEWNHFVRSGIVFKTRKGNP